MKSIQPLAAGRRPLPNGDDSSPRGFALVLALSMMAFMLLLLVALASLIGVESGRSQIELDQFAARQNALLGLRIAVAQLQKETGDDRSATAPAEASGVLSTAWRVDDPEFDPATAVHPSRRHWVGAYAYDEELDLSQEMIVNSVNWLVSGNATGVDVLEGEPNEHARLLYFAGNEEIDEIIVEAPREPIPSGDSLQTGGHFAYWAADESMKAKVNLTPVIVEDEESLSDLERRSKFYTTQRYGGENIAGLENLSRLYSGEGDDEELERFNRIVSVSDLKMSGLVDDETDLGPLWFDLTTNSWGLLTDGRFGGFKRDLTTMLTEKNLYHAQSDPTYRFWSLVVPEDLEDWRSLGSTTNQRIFNQNPGWYLRGPSWALLHDFAKIHEEIGSSADASVEARIGIGSGSGIGGNGFPPFHETMTLGPVLVYQGLTFGLKLSGPEDSEDILIIRRPKEAPGGRDARDAKDPAPGANLQDFSVREIIYHQPNQLLTSERLNDAISSGDYGPLEAGHYVRRYYRLTLTVEPVVALWNPYDVKLRANDYLVEFTHNNGLWGAQPALTLRNTSVQQWLNFNADNDLRRGGDNRKPYTTLVNVPHGLLTNVTDGSTIVDDSGSVLQNSWEFFLDNHPWQVDWSAGDVLRGRGFAYNHYYQLFTPWESALMRLDNVPWGDVQNYPPSNPYPLPDAFASRLIHLNELMPDYDYYRSIVFNEYTRPEIVEPEEGFEGDTPDAGLSNEIGLYNSQDLASGGVKPLNLHFAIIDAELEPGEIKWFSLQGNHDDYTRTNSKILKEGLNHGTVEFPITPKATFYARSVTNPLEVIVNGSYREEPASSRAQGGTYAYVSSHTMHANNQRIGQRRNLGIRGGQTTVNGDTIWRGWSSGSGEERSFTDYGLIVDDEFIPNSPILHAGNNVDVVSEMADNLNYFNPAFDLIARDFQTIGLSHRSGQYSMHLRMINPAFKAQFEETPGQYLAEALDFPFGKTNEEFSGTSGDPLDPKWVSLRYVNVSPARNINMDTIQGSQLSATNERPFVSSGVFLMAPNHEDWKPGTESYSDHKVGVKLIAHQNILSRYHGWNSYVNDAEIGSNPSNPRVGLGTGSPSYGFALFADGSDAFEEDELWHESAVIDPESGGDPEYRVVLFHLPRDELFSVGHFQHLPISRTLWDPSYVVGNSMASPWIPADDTGVELVRSSASSFTLQDRSYFLNNALFDSYYFSTWNPTESQNPRNPRYVVTDPLPPDQHTPNPEREEEAELYQRSNNLTSRLLVDGPFNINSTSVEAWKAVLSGMNLQDLSYRDVAGGTLVEAPALQNPFLRSPMPSGGKARQPDGFSFPTGDTAYWRGYREIEKDQLDELAEYIVAEIRERGPFRTVGEFINRRPGEPDSEAALMGAIQAAIEKQSENGSAPVNPGVVRGDVLAEENVGNYAYPQAALGPRHQGAPGYLMQSDVVTPLAPFLTARGDTFVVRSYGDTVDPMTASVKSRVWLEAIVQRLPEFVDTDNEATDSLEDLSQLNEVFGRRYQILSVRWLANDEI